VAGPIFVCELTHGKGYCVVILNKKGLENLIIEMTDMLDVEIATEFLIVTFRSHSVEETVLGFFIRDEPVGTREKNSTLIKHCWEKVVAENGGAQGNTEILDD